MKYSKFAKQYGKLQLLCKSIHLKYYKTQIIIEFLLLLGQLGRQDSHQKAEKEQKYLRAGHVQALLGQPCLRAGLVLKPYLSQGWNCLRAGSDKKLQGGGVSWSKV